MSGGKIPNIDRAYVAVITKGSGGQAEIDSGKEEKGSDDILS